jgi:arabinoxylan arabinofuranohydrolase
MSLLGSTSLPALLLFGAGAQAENPIVQTIYTTDPAPVVYNNRVYVLTGHDEDGSTTYVMKNWHLYSTADMANWQDHGSPASLSTFAWSDANAWAGQIVQRNNKFYLYAPVRHSTGPMAVGVATSNNIEGPYTDALGKPLVENNQFDPTVYIDSDDQAYLYWGNPDLNYVKLNNDMISYSGRSAALCGEPCRSKLTVPLQREQNRSYCCWLWHPTGRGWIHFRRGPMVLQTW